MSNWRCTLSLELVLILRGWHWWSGRYMPRFHRNLSIFCDQGVISILTLVVRNKEQVFLELELQRIDVRRLVDMPTYRHKDHTQEDWGFDAILLPQLRHQWWITTLINLALSLGL
jgi:hypothetical protein